MSTPWALNDFDGHEAIQFVTDIESGLKAIIAIHSTHLGPAAGGSRFWHYAHDEQALIDALRLSRGMSYKNAMAGLALGGGKTVILADKNMRKTPEMLRAFGRAVDRLGGNYVTAEDVNMSVADMLEVAKETQFVAGLPAAGGDVGGDPGPFTSLGVFLGVKQAVRHKLGKDSLEGLHIAIQGAGSVAKGLARHAAAEGARISIADIDEDKARALADSVGGSVVAADAILSLEADVLSPCALGAILNAETIPQLNVPVIAGGANNQLATPEDGERVKECGILYAPDYVINAGGIINVCTEYLADGDASTVQARIEGIPARLAANLERKRFDRQGPGGGRRRDGTKADRSRLIPARLHRSIEARAGLG